MLGYNVLNDYRSSTYQFTLSALDKMSQHSPEVYSRSASNLVILKSGGKGTAGLLVDSKYTRAEGDSRSYALYTPDDQVIKDTVAGFNANSPGRFDMFIDNVEIESVMAFTKDSNTSLPTSFRFDVIEPYSINGFIEALQASAVAAGYPTYAQASFLLKIEFIGYHADEEFPEPELIPASTRYFIIGFTGLEVSVTQAGTRYKCTAVPYNEKSFGQPNKLVKPINCSGTNVKTLLENFIKKLNIQFINGANDAGVTNHVPDKYAVSFSNWTDTSNEAITKIAGSILVKPLTDAGLYTFADSPTAANGDKLNPNEISIQFNDGLAIHECIAAVIRDSEYVRNILKMLITNPSDVLDAHGMIDYFLVNIEVKNTETIDTISRSNYQVNTYVITPFKIHYTAIPGYKSDSIPQKSYQSLREYNYLYTGKNLDILDFRLNFNTLFFEAIPSALGNNKLEKTRNAAGSDGSNEFDKIPSASIADSGTTINIMRRDTNVTPIVSSYAPVTNVVPDGGKAGQPIADPYGIMAINMHNALINSNASMITGEMTILGDPYYLISGGIGAYKPTKDESDVSGEARRSYGDLLITVNFFNPIDIGDFENEEGMMQFKSEHAGFSGIYKITRVNTNFTAGLFKQQLHMIRMPGQKSNQSKELTKEAAGIFNGGKTITSIEGNAPITVKSSLDMPIPTI